jgi:hypothetical protein
MIAHQPQHEEGVSMRLVEDRSGDGQPLLPF